MSSPLVYFYDDGQYIRVVDGRQNTTVYFNKINLSVQMDTVSHFFLKNELDVGHYAFTDVAFPICATLKELVVKLIQWAKSNVLSWDLNESHVLTELQMNVNKNPMEFDELVVNGATCTYDSAKSRVNMDITAFNSRAVRQSKLYLQYRIGQEILAVVSGNLADPAVAATNMISRIGIYENYADIKEDNPGFAWSKYPSAGTAGVFFMYDSTQTVPTDRINAVLRRIDQTDLVIPQSAWNIDKLDGTGPSKVNIDWQTQNIFVFEMKNRQGTTFKAGLMNKSSIIFCHEFVETATGKSLTTTYQPCLPVRWEVSGTGEAAATGRLSQGHAIVYAKQARDYNNIRSFGTASDQQIIHVDDMKKNALTLKLSRLFSRCRIQLTRLQIVNTQTGFAKWELVWEPTGLNAQGQVITAPADDTFTFVQSRSGADVSRNNAIDITGGTVIASGFIGSNTVENIDLDDQAISIMSKINGTSDKIAIRLSGMYGTCNIIANAFWKEYL